MDLSLFIESDNKEVQTISNVYPKYNYTNVILSEEYLINIFQANGIKLINNKLNMKLFQQAFTHKSYCTNDEVILIENIDIDVKKIDEDLENNTLVDLQLESSDKLEWYGDSVIGMVLSFYLVNRFPNENEGFLTKLRSSILKCDCLSEISIKLGLDKFLLISKYIESINGRTNKNRLQEMVQSLCACIDIEYSPYYRNNFIINIIESLIDIPEKIFNDINYKDILLKYYQKKKIGAPEFHLAQQEGPANNRIFTIIIKDKNNTNDNINESNLPTGVDTSKKKAEHLASKNALKELGLLNENNILQWKYTKQIINVNEIVNNNPLYYYKYNSENEQITENGVNNLLSEYGIDEKINDISLYQNAFVHSSYCKTYTDKYEKNFASKYDIPCKMLNDIKLINNSNNKLVELFDTSYEQLEWYGDSVLKYVITKYLLKRYTSKYDGFYTDIRSKLTNSYTLYQIAIKLNFDKYIILSNYQESVKSRYNQSNLEDILEAFIGALITDLGEIITETFIINMYESIIDIADKINNNNNYKDLLLKYYQKQKWGFPIYSHKSEQNKSSTDNYTNLFTCYVTNNLTNDIVGLGRGKSKKTAEQNASKNALIQFNEL
jgi:ribonuclease-3